MGKAPILILSGVVLALCFLLIPALPWNFWLFGALGLAGLAIAFRIAPFLAITTELVPLKNAAPSWHFVWHFRNLESP